MVQCIYRGLSKAKAYDNHNNNNNRNINMVLQFVNTFHIHFEEYIPEIVRH